MSRTRKHSVPVRLLLALAIAAGMAAAPGGAVVPLRLGLVLPVDCNTSVDDIAAVQDAVDAAGDGDTIQLSGVCDFSGAKPHGGDIASITATAVLIRAGSPFSAGLTIESAEDARATVLGSGTQTAFMVAPGNDNVTIRGLNLLGFARPIVVWSASNTTIGDAAATSAPSADGNRIAGDAMNSAVLAIGNNKDASGATPLTAVSYGSGSARSALLANNGRLTNLRVLGNYITYGAVDAPDGQTRDVVAIDVRQRNQGNVDGVEIAHNAVGFLTASFPSFNINAVRVHAHSGDPNYHLSNVSIRNNNLGRLEELGDPVADVNAGGRAGIVLVRARNFEIAGNGVRVLQTPMPIDMPGGGIVVSDSSDGVIRGNGVISVADSSGIAADMGAIAVVDDVNVLFGSPAGGVPSTNVKVLDNIVGPATNDMPGAGAQRGILVNGSSFVEVRRNTVKNSSSAAVSLATTVRGPSGTLPKAVVSSLVCDNVLDGNTDDPAEVFAERAPSYSSFPGGSRFPGNGECVEAGLRFTPAGLTLTEGGPARTYLARLTLRPAANVTVMPSGGSQASVSPQTLTFTPSNWYAGQIVTVAAVDDALVEGTTIHPVAHTASSSDAAYAGVVSEMPLTIKDNDAGTLVLIESDGSTEVAEGGATDTFTVSLTAPPAAPATISFVPDPQITIVPTAVTFTAQNFATPQTITVTAVDDAVRENDHSGSIEGSSSDPLFGSVPSVLASIKDNDAPAAPAIAFPSEGQILTATDVTVAGTGEPGATVEIFEGMASMGTALVDANGMWSAQIAFGADMTHVITAAQTGTDGLTGGASAARSFSIDMTAPAAPTITGPADGSSFASGNVTVTGTAEPNATVSVYGNGGLKATTTASGSGAWSVETGFVAGSHAITATARDGAGHESGPSLPVNITVALLTPTIVDPAQGSYAKSPVTVRGTADGSHAFVYLYDFGVLKAVVPVTSGVPGTWQTQVAFDSGVRRLTAISRSAANTISPVSAVRTFTADNTAPTAVVHRPQFYTVFGIVTDGTIRGTAREGEVWDSGVARVDLIYLDASGAQVAAAQATCANCPGSFVSWSHKPDLLPGFYTVQARATDRVGNVSAAGTMAFLLVR